MQILTNQLKTTFDHSMKTLEQILDYPIAAWSSGSPPIWNHFLHTLMGTEFWIREDYDKPFAFSLNLPEKYAPLYEESWFPENFEAPDITTAREYFNAVSSKANKVFSAITDETLTEKPWQNADLSYIEIINGQIRHIMHHAGMIAQILETNGFDELPWIGC